MLRVDLENIINVKYFPDGTLNLLNLPDLEPLGDSSLYIEWKFENITEQIVLYNLVNHYRDHGFKQFYLVLPYIPNARMDRTKSNTECHTLKWFAKFVNDLHFDTVIILDPHSDVSTALLNNVEYLDVADLVKNTIQRCDAEILCFPDAGSFKRYSSSFKDCGLPIVYCEKNREWNTGIITSMKLINPQNIDLKDKKVLIVDDICSRGGTFKLAALALKDFGVGEINLYVSHCENTIFAGELLKEDSPINKIFTTDSLKHADHIKLLTYELHL